MIRRYREADLGTSMAANVRAIGFYRRLGFRPLEVADPGEGAGEGAVVHLGRAL